MRKKHFKVPNQLQLVSVKALTNNQHKALVSNNSLVLNGAAGSGKSFIALFKAFSAALKGDYKKVVIIRSIVETRKIGFLPGNEKEKIEVYETPYSNICRELFSDTTAYNTLKSKGLLDFMPTSFIRGTTLEDSYIIVDECQNMTYHELDSVITRVGMNSKIIFCGDYFQSDILDSGINKFFEVLNQMSEFTTIEFGIEDIVRSEFVKNYLIQKYKVHGREKI